MTTTLAVILVLILFPILFILWATESTPQRVRRLRGYGWSQQRIADKLGITRYRVRQALC